MIIHSLIHGAEIAPSFARSGNKSPLKSCYKTRLQNRVTKSPYSTQKPLQNRYGSHVTQHILRSGVGQLQVLLQQKKKRGAP